MLLGLPRFLPWLVAMASMCAANSAHAEGGPVVFQETVLGPMPADPCAWSISPDAERLELVAESCSRQQVYIDGNSGPIYSTIIQLSSLPHGGEGLRLLMISPDQKVIAYCASKSSTASVMVFNHKEGPAFDCITQAKFDPVGHRLTYIAMKDRQQFVVVDGNAGVGTQYALASEVCFSSDEQHFGFAQQTGDPPQAPGDGEDELAVRNARQDIFDHSLRPLNGAALLAARAKASSSSGVPQQELYILGALGIAAPQSKKAEAQVPAAGEGLE